MPEKFRRVKREKSLFVRSAFPKRFWIAGSMLVLAAAGSAGWFFLISPALDSKKENETAPIDRTLAAAVCRAGECFWLNREGVSFGKSGQTEGNLILSLEDKTGRDLKTGIRFLDSGTLAELIFLKQRIYDELRLSLRIGEINDAKLSDFSFITKEGWLLKISTVQNAYKTVEILKQTIAEIKKSAPTSGLEYIDLRVPNKVYYKFR